MKEPNQKDILEDEEEFEDMDDDYFAAIGNSYEILSSYDVKNEPLDEDVTDAPIELIQIKEEFFDSEDTEHISTSNTQDQSASTSKKNDDKSSHSKEKPSSLKKTDNDKEKPKDPKSGSKLGRHSISDREIKRRDSEAVRPEERSSRDDRSKRNDRSQVLERSRARTTRRSPPYRHRSRSRDRRSPFNRGGNTRNTKKPSFLEEITSKYPDLMDQSQNVGRHNHNSYIPPQPQMMAFQHPNDMFQGYQPMPNMYPQTQMIHPQPVPAPLLQQYQQFVIDPYQNPAMAGSYVAPVASTVAITPVPVPSVPNPPSWQTRKASTSADPRLAKRSANVSPPGNSSSGESSSLVPKPINISQEVNNSFKAKKISLSDLLSQRQRSTSSNQMHDCAKSAIQRCKKVLELIDDLENKRFTSKFIYTKSLKSPPYLKNVERQNKTPMIISKANPLYRSVTLNRDSLLSFPHTNLCYKKSFALAQAIGVDLNELSTRVKKSYDSEKLKILSQSVSDTVVTSSSTRDFAVQTEVFRCMDCVLRDCIVTTDQGTQVQRFIPNKDKEVQTTKNVDGFYYAIDTLKGLSDIQRKAIKDFKAAMGIKDDVGISSIQERLQHRAASSSAPALQSTFQPVEETSRRSSQMSQKSQGTNFEQIYANPSPPRNNEIIVSPFDHGDFTGHAHRSSIASRLGRRINSNEYSRNFYEDTASVSPRRMTPARRSRSPARRSRSPARRCRSPARRSRSPARRSRSPARRSRSPVRRSPIHRRSMSRDSRDRSYSPIRDVNSQYIHARYSPPHFPDNSARYYDHQGRGNNLVEQHYYNDEGSLRRSISSENHRIKRERSNETDDVYRGNRHGRF